MLDNLRIGAAGLGAFMGDFIGSLDGLLYALVLLVIVDYMTGVLCAIVEKNLSSNIGYRGICQKVMIFCLVGVAHILDIAILNTGSMLRTAVIFFYLANEGISILENAGRVGLPIPAKLRAVFQQLKNK